jgi:hypothetical protein
VADRTKKHRKNARVIDMMAALAAARLVGGRGAGDAGRSLSQWMRKIAARSDVPEDYRDEIEEAAKKLLGRSR